MSRWKVWLGVGIGVVFPILLLADGVLQTYVSSPHITYAEYLPTARLVAAGFSIYGLLATWFFRWRSRRRPRSQSASGGFAVYFMGDTAAMVPSFCGLFLLEAFGASILEQLAWTVVSLSAGTVWLLVTLAPTARASPPPLGGSRSTP